MVNFVDHVVHHEGILICSCYLLKQTLDDHQLVWVSLDLTVGLSGSGPVLSGQGLTFRGQQRRL